MHSRVPAPSATLNRACAVLVACVCGVGLMTGEARASCGEHLQSVESFREGWRISPTGSESTPIARCNGPHCQQRPAAPLPQPQELPRIELSREQIVAVVSLASDTTRAGLNARRQQGGSVRALAGFAEMLERPPR